MLLSTIPSGSCTRPPLIDYLAHIGRYQVQLHLADSPGAPAELGFSLAAVGNLGVELLIAPLARLLGLERTAWLIALALPLLMISAIGRISRALHGELTPFAIAAAWFAMAYPFQLGFVNYWLGCASWTFHAFAYWVEQRQATIGCGPCAPRCSLPPPAGPRLAHALWLGRSARPRRAFELCPQA